MSKSNTTPTQSSLSDVSYDDHSIPTVDESRVTGSIETSEDLYECSVGDVLWVKGTEYLVLKRCFGFFHTPLLVVGEDGTQGRFIGGLLNQESSTAGVAWARDVVDEEEASLEDLISRFDHVERLESDRLDLMHNWTPDTNQRECPECGRNGTALRVERQASKAVEVRHCVNTDCHHLYRFVREMPTGDEDAVILEFEVGDDTLTPQTIAGVFRAEEQDDFKFPVETNNGRDDGFWTASEIAAFVNPKMCGEPDDRFGVVTIEEQRRRPGQKIVWKDAPGYDADMRVTFREIVDESEDGHQYSLGLRALPSDAFGEVIDQGESDCPTKDNEFKAPHQ